MNKITKHIHRSRSADSNSGLRKIGALKKRQRNIRHHQVIRIWISCLAIFFLFLHQIASINTSPSIKLDSSDSDLLYGGFKSKDDMLLTLEAPEHTYPTSFLHALNIKPAELQRTILKSHWKPSSETLSSGPLVVWSFSPTYQPPYLGQSTNLESKFAFRETFGHNKIIYGTPLPSTATGTLYNTPVLSGVTREGKEFFVLKNSGNIVTGWDLAQEVSSCYKTQDRELSYVSCPNSPSFETKVVIENATYRTNATYLKARSGDILRYSLSAQSNTPTEYTPQIQINDILEYSDLEEYPGAVFNTRNQSLIWRKQQLLPNQPQTVSFTVKVKDRIPLEHQNNNNGHSYDCRMSAYFGGTSSVDIVCPPQKVIERLIIGPSQTQVIIMIAWLILLTNSLLIFYNNRILRHLQVSIDSTHRGISP